MYGRWHSKAIIIYKVSSVFLLLSVDLAAGLADDARES